MRLLFDENDGFIPLSVQNELEQLDFVCEGYRRETPYIYHKFSGVSFMPQEVDGHGYIKLILELRTAKSVRELGLEEREDKYGS